MAFGDTRLQYGRQAGGSVDEALELAEKQLDLLDFEEDYSSYTTEI